MSTAPPTSAEPLALARHGILGPAGLDDTRLGQALDLVLGSAVDSADLYFQLAHEESWALEAFPSHSSVPVRVSTASALTATTELALTTRYLLPYCSSVR
ncbi:MAG: hypothetical protein U1F06_04000 [Steroidobacteraceae bacterium]